MSENKKIETEHAQTSLETESPEAHLIELSKSITQTLERIYFALGILISTVIPQILLIIFNPSESGTFRIIAVIIGIAGLLGGVAVGIFAGEKQRKHRVKELREAERGFFDRIKRDLSSRLAPKVR